MVRNGGFCTYNGNEYELTEDMDGNLLILTEDPFLAKDGFVDKWGSGVYSKKVSPNEISNCYRITTKGKINGKIVHISKENEKEYFVGTSDSEVARELGFERTDKYYYDKWVPKEEVEVFEQKEEVEL